MAATPEAEPDLTYEQARDELVQIVSRLEAGGIALEESLALWQRGEELAALCERYLDGARAKLDAAVADRNSGNNSGQDSRPDAGSDSGDDTDAPGGD